MKTTDPENLAGQREAELRAERDHYRQMAERLGQKSVADARDHSRMIRNLRQTEEKLLRSQEELERKIGERTAELVRRNEELRESAARYDELVERIPHGVYIMRSWDEGAIRFEYVSPRLCRIIGLDGPALLGDAALAMGAAHPEDRDSLMQSCREATRTWAPYCWEGRFLVGGETRWICIESEPTLVPEPDGSMIWNGVISDITDRRRTEERLRQSEELYRLLNELAPNAITVCDLAAVVRVVNPVSLKLFGVPDESRAIGREVFDWVAPESLEAARQAFNELFLKGALCEVELTLRREDDSRFTGEVNASLLRDCQGIPKLVIIVLSDITQRKLAEAERLKLQKLEAIGTLAGGIAHDFNNLLQGVFGYVALAKLNLGDPQAAGSLLGQAEQAVSQAVTLTSQLLTFAKGGQPHKMRVVLAETVETAARFALSGSRSSCQIAVDPQLWATDADQAQIGQAIQNIVLNASQAMGQAGSVAIEAENVELPAGSNPSLPQGGRFVRIRISDTGSGIPRQLLPTIFDPYVTTKEKGSGLGLATSYSIVKRHDGTITVSSEPGVGTTFSLYLPALEPQEESPHAAPDSAGAPVEVAARQWLVLVMDDEEMVRNVACKMLEMCGVEVVSVRDGDEAVAQHRRAWESGRPFDLVMLDLTVKGGMGGEEAIRKIRETDQQVKAVVCSGYSDNPVLSNFRAHGFDACLRKPYNMNALRQSLAALAATEPAPAGVAAAPAGAGQDSHFPAPAAGPSAAVK